MKPLHPVLIGFAVLALISAAGLGADAAASRPDKIRVLLVHGGHEFETNQFLQVFQDNPEVTLTVVQHPAAQAWFKPDRAREYLDKWTDHGVERPGSTYKHDVDFKIHVADPAHPITRAITDFTIHDETYGGFEVKPDSHVLLTTDEPGNGRNLAWWKTYGAARVVYLQLGHDHQAWDNANYRRLLAQAIRWAVGRDNN